MNTFIFDSTKNININLSVASEIITNVSSYTVRMVSGNEYEFSDIDSINKIKNFLNCTDFKEVEYYCNCMDGA